jgi:predicted nucleic acid-binding protein
LTVVDRSAMVELIAAGTAAGEAIADRLAVTLSLNAPYVLDGEVVSALLGLMRGQKITERQAAAVTA